HYLDGRSVAALVYQRRKHIVNVFVWPVADNSDSAVKSVEHDGYNLLHWRRGGMNYWMASDLHAQEMNTFAGLLRAVSAAPAPPPYPVPPPVSLRSVWRRSAMLPAV